MMLVTLVATTVIGGAIGAAVGFLAGGVGAAPGAVVGADLGFSAGMSILTWLGLGFLAVSIAQGFGEMIGAVSHATTRAWDAPDSPRPRAEIEKAGDEYAYAIALLFKFILIAIVLRLAGPASEALIAQLRKSRLGEGFANWVVANREALLKNPKLRPKPKAVVSEKPVEQASTPSQVKNAKTAKEPPPPPPPPPKVTRPDTSQAKYRPDDAYKKPDGNWDWPPKDGFDGPRTPTRLPEGAEIDRFGGEKGSFVSPADTPFEQRALAPSSLTEPYYKYEVTRPLPVETGKIAPAFDQPGGGVQHFLDWETIAQSNNTTVSAIRGYQGATGEGGIAWLVEQGGYLTRLVPPGGIPP